MWKRYCFILATYVSHWSQDKIVQSCKLNMIHVGRLYSINLHVLICMALYHESFGAWVLQTVNQREGHSSPLFFAKIDINNIV